MSIKSIFNLNAPVRIPELDGIRGLALLFVLFSHLTNHNITLFPSIKLSGHASGRIGVYIFFSLSSFLLTINILNLTDAEKKLPSVWIAFFFRRLIRIYPLYCLALLLVYLAPELQGIFEFPDFTLALFFNHLMIREGMNHFWIIPLEIKFYLFLPAFMVISFAILRLNLPTFIILNFIILVMVPFIWNFFIPGITGLKSLFANLPVFLPGVICACIQTLYKKSPIQLNRNIIDSIGVLLLLATILLMPNLFERVTGHTNYFLFTRNFLVFWGIVCSSMLFCAINGSGIFSKLLSMTIIRIIGVISFSAYVCHWFILNLVNSLDISQIQKISYFFLITFLVSFVSYVFIEKPLSSIRIRVKKNITRTVINSNNNVNVVSRRTQE